MSRIESGFVPLPKVEQEQPEPNLEIRLNLPEYVDQDRIGVNLTQIVRLNDWGGIRRLRVVGKTDMDTSSESPELVGINPDGSAIASKKVAKVTVPTFDSSSRNADWHNYSIANRWVNAGVNINLDEMSQRLKDKPEVVRSPANWAKELDNGIKATIRAKGHMNLLHSMETRDKSDYGIMMTVSGIASILLFLSEGRIAPFTVVGVWAGSRVVSLARSVAQSDWRFSFIPGYQIDRAAILSIQSRLKTVVKDLGQVKS